MTKREGHGRILDASAILAVLLQEPGHEELVSRLARYDGGRRGRANRR